MPSCHYVPRSKGGLGIEQNVVTLCMKCHHNYDNGLRKEEKEAIRRKIKAHLAQLYPNWSNYTLTYKKGCK